MAWLAWAALLGGLSACGSSIDDSLEGKDCSADGACVDGYVCSAQRKCVRAAQLLEDAGAD